MRACVRACVHANVCVASGFRAGGENQCDCACVCLRGGGGCNGGGGGVTGGRSV